MHITFKLDNKPNRYHGFICRSGSPGAQRRSGARKKSWELKKIDKQKTNKQKKGLCSAFVFETTDKQQSCPNFTCQCHKADNLLFSIFPQQHTEANYTYKLCNNKHHCTAQMFT